MTSGLQHKEHGKQATVSLFLSGSNHSVGGGKTSAGSAEPGKRVLADNNRGTGGTQDGLVRALGNLERPASPGVSRESRRRLELFSKVHFLPLTARRPTV